MKRTFLYHSRHVMGSRWSVVAVAQRRVMLRPLAELEAPNFAHFFAVEAFGFATRTTAFRAEKGYGCSVLG